MHDDDDGDDHRRQRGRAAAKCVHLAQVADKIQLAAVIGGSASWSVYGNDKRMSLSAPYMLEKYSDPMFCR